ncbi:PAC2 family protein [Janibacter sp. DB-40]|uniref:PAC2 family protein n=1 Tax=Janibacter sp. DB-40 TaxID=3028808 RepID=UPI0024062ADB|nr:PAC2 family protein [Janibacter sp. DB-40]
MIEIEDLPELHDPVMILAFEGWNDAGEAASRVIEHLIELWDAETVAAIDPEDYYDFQVNRPQVTNQGQGRGIHWNTTRILLASPDSLGRDVLLVTGTEPSFRWRAFTTELLDLGVAHGVETVICLGALLADVAHTRPIPVSSSSPDEMTSYRLELEPSQYEGPTGITGVVADGAHQADMVSISSWAAVPHYAAQVPCPKASLALLGQLEDLLDTVIEHGELEEEARAWERGVDELATSDEDIAEYVSALESAQDTSELPEASGDAIAKEFERYLRRRGEDTNGPG